MSQQQQPTGSEPEQPVVGPQQPVPPARPADQVPSGAQEQPGVPTAPTEQTPSAAPAAMTPAVGVPPVPMPPPGPAQTWVLPSEYGAAGYGPAGYGPAGYGPAGYGAGQPPVPPVAPGTPAGGQLPPTVAVDPRRRRVRRTVLVGAAAAVLAAVLTGGYALGRAAVTTTASDTTVVQRAPQDGEGQSGGGTSGGGYGSDSGPSGQGYGAGQAPFGGSFGGGSGSSQSTQSAAATATAAQEVGVVTIVSTLGYESGEAAGTGSILSSDGYVLTNNHVIDGATSIEVTVESTGKQYTATVVGTDSTADVAVLKLTDASGLTPVTVDSDGVSSGEAVTAIGNAEGTGTLVAAAGTVTATDQTMTASEDGANSETLSGLIEFSAAVVSGDSGGPLVDSSGEVVGMTTAASSGQGATTAYAIDISDALKVVKQIEAGDSSGDVTLGYPAFLGVSVSSQTSASSTSGATIAGVIADTPAAKIGLAAGDTITAVDGTAVTSASNLSTVLKTYRPGDKVTITWVSGTTGATKTSTVTLISGPAD